MNNIRIINDIAGFDVIKIQQKNDKVYALGEKSVSQKSTN